MAPITILGRKICFQVVLKRHELDLAMEKYSVANILKDIFSPPLPVTNLPTHRCNVGSV
jgi:hypothetical protein